MADVCARHLTHFPLLRLQPSEASQHIHVIYSQGVAEFATVKGLGAELIP